MKDPIPFVENRFHYLSPFSAHTVSIWGEVFPTVEHAYQAARIRPSAERNQIKFAASPMDAWREGQRLKKDPKLRVLDFAKDDIMEELLRAKASQHSDIVDILRESADRMLLKNFDTDYHWGTGHDGSGRNQMGKIWMKIRSELVSED